MKQTIHDILEKYRAASQTEREKGTYFEELIRTYFRYEASYADLYSDVWLFADWAKEIGTPQFGINAKSAAELLKCIAEEIADELETVIGLLSKIAQNFRNLGFNNPLLPRPLIMLEAMCN
jgi:hypothetical protein